MKKNKPITSYLYKKINSSISEINMISFFNGLRLLRLWLAMTVYKKWPLKRPYPNYLFTSTYCMMV